MKTNEKVTRTLHTAGQLFVRESAPGEAKGRKICGYAIMFNVPSVILDATERSEEREIITPGAVTKEFLDSCDIIMTMYHDRQKVLARSNKGKGTLSYRVDSKGVYFEFEAANTANGNEALELIKRGDITGCSFVFTTYYNDPAFVERKEKKTNGYTEITYYVKRMTGIYDFTVTTKPAYPDTSVEAREAQQRKAERKARQVREIRERIGYYKRQAKAKPTKAEAVREIREKVREIETLLK